MSRIIFMFACLLGAGAAWGQSPVKFSSTELVGLSEGQAGGAFQFQTIDGISRGPWFLGGGAGLDYYKLRSIPLFVAVGRDLRLTKKEGLNFYVHGGTNLPWEPKPSSTAFGYSTSYHPGEYWSGGLSYVWQLGDHPGRAVLLTFGYTTKRLRMVQTSGSEPPCYLLGNCAMSETTTFTYFNHVFQLMAGYRF